MEERKDTHLHRGKRKKLVEKLKSKGIKDPLVLDAIGHVPRHFFFPEEFADHAYEDRAFPIEAGQTISQPYTVAAQTQLLELTPGEKVLEIGTGSGYQAAVLCKIGAKVTSIEVLDALYKKPETTLKAMGCEVALIFGDGSLGYEAHAPYQAIIVTAGAPKVPPKLIEQLDVGGRMIIPVGSEDSQEMLKIVKKEDGSIEQRKQGRFVFVPLKGKDAW